MAINSLKNERINADESLFVQLIDGDTDQPISIAGASSITATATNVDTDDVINFVSAVVSDDVNGIFELTRAIGTFSEEATYDVLITYTKNSKVIKYPKRMGDLKLKIS